MISLKRHFLVRLIFGKLRSDSIFILTSLGSVSLGTTITNMAASMEMCVPGNIRDFLNIYRAVQSLSVKGVY